jgi:signal transduction histidine kinase
MEPLPSIAEKLARLAALEGDFQRVLEAEKLEALAEFAAGAGHEINNPLAVISGRAQLLLRDESDPERRRALAVIAAQAVRVHEMIADLMLFARPPKPAFQRIDLQKTLDALWDVFYIASQEQETALFRVGIGEPVFVTTDPTQLAVAIRAVVQNALEALRHGGRIEIGFEIDTHQPPGEARILIIDDGPGIQPEERRHLFDPYYSARQAGRGLGLGLSKAWRIITNHGGRIEVESTPGRGAKFCIVLPCE